MAKKKRRTTKRRTTKRRSTKRKIRIKPQNRGKFTAW